MGNGTSCHRQHDTKQFYAESQSQTYPTDTILIYNQYDFFYCDILQDAVQSAITKETESHYSSLQFALYYLNNELDDRMHKYETVWHLQRGIWAPTNAYVSCNQFLQDTLANDGVFYFMCAVLARQTIWGILPNAIRPTNPDNVTWVQWKNSQELSYVFGNVMDTYTTDNPNLYDMHKALDL